MNHPALILLRGEQLPPVLCHNKQYNEGSFYTTLQHGKPVVLCAPPPEYFMSAAAAAEALGHGGGGGGSGIGGAAVVVTGAEAATAATAVTVVPAPETFGHLGVLPLKSVGNFPALR